MCGHLHNSVFLRKNKSGNDCCLIFTSSLLVNFPDDFRIFCGDLGNEVNDDILARAFSRYPSFLKAKVIRDKRTGKTKGYGFVSFKDPNDYVRAMREINGKLEDKINVHLDQCSKAHSLIFLGTTKDPLNKCLVLNCREICG